ncbi:CD209 antigen-like protein 2 [Biomphalaria glabrata]|uniref:CD209 antigen-like protein 2 n=1 Tax=Biomphalaria glabrata TaxID=6526 RepID=A0A9W3BPW4_BIOGL|nr:CD209 antigen-like protein 2 [Biomphalaria glabrata]
MLSSGPGYQATSVSACATLCSKYVQDCYSFTYNRKSKLCTPGSRLISSATLFNSTLGRLYYVPGKYCDTSKVNFTIATNGSVSTCLWLSDILATYNDSLYKCQDLGSNLFTIKVPEKLNILLNAVKTFNVEYWIGLNDRDQEGVFRWVDDGSVWTKSFPLFAPYQPDNMLGEDCIQYHPIFYPINDYLCSHESRFICEMNLIG